MKAHQQAGAGWAVKRPKLVLIQLPKGYRWVRVGEIYRDDDEEVDACLMHWVKIHRQLVSFKCSMFKRAIRRIRPTRSGKGGTR